MAASIISTVGGASSNSYLTVSAAQDIADIRLGTLAWTTATTDQKTRALISACQLLGQLDWIGSRATTTQALPWPRTGAECGEKRYTASEIPDELLEGQFDLAEALLTTPDLVSGNSSALAELIPGIPNSSLKSARLDVISVDFQQGGAPTRKNALTVLPHLANLFGCLCLSRAHSATGNIRIRRA